LQIHFLADMASRRPVDSSHDRQSDRRVKRISGARQPPIMIIRSDTELTRWLGIPAHSDILDIPPSDLIAESQLIVRRRIKNVKRAANPVMRVMISGRVVVFPAKPRLPCGRWNRVPGYPMSCPGANPIRSERAELARHFQPIIDELCFAHPPDTDRFEIQSASGSIFRNLLWRQPPEYIGFDRGTGHEFPDTSVESVEVIASLGPVEPFVCRIDDRRGEGIDPITAVLNGQTDRIKRPADIDPVEIAQQPLLAKDEILAAGPQTYRTLIGVPELHISEPQIHGIGEGRSVRDAPLKVNSGILAFEHELQPARCAQAKINPQAVQQMHIILPWCKASIKKAFVPCSKQAPEVQPVRQSWGDFACNRLGGYRSGEKDPHPYCLREPTIHQIGILYQL
jgi:hypothetical protein